jgi:hypothetical protein
MRRHAGVTWAKHEVEPRTGADALQLTLRFSFRARLTAGVRVSAGTSRHRGEGCKSLTVKVKPTTRAPRHAQAPVTVSAKR